MYKRQLVHSFENTSISGANVFTVKGIHLWVGSIHSVLEFNSSTGALVRDVHAVIDKIDEPSSIAIDNSDVWIANGGGNSVTEISSTTGALVRVIDSEKYRFAAPNDITIRNSIVWVVNQAGNSVTELNGSTGRCV